MLIFSAILLTVNLAPLNADTTEFLNNQTQPTPDLMLVVEQHITDLDLGSAKEILLAALDSDPNDPEVNFLLGLIFSITEPERASGYLDKAASLEDAFYIDAHSMINTLQISGFSEEEAYSLIQIGQTLGGMEKWNLAIIAFSEAVADDPEYAEAWAYLGMSQIQLGQDASDALQTALLLNPQSLSANVFYAQFLASEDRPSEGLPYIHAALEIDPDNTSLIYEAGLYNAEMGNLLEAFSYYEEAVLKNPDEYESWYQLANFCLNYEYQIEQIGLPAARQSLLISPNDSNALILLGRAYSQLGNPFLGEKLLLQALQLDPESINALYYLGIINISLGELTEARSYLQQVLTLSNNENLRVQVQNIIDTYLP